MTIFHDPLNQIFRPFDQELNLSVKLKKNLSVILAHPFENNFHLRKFALSSEEK